MTTKTYEQTIYISDDGIEFRSEEECQKHEQANREVWAEEYIKGHQLFPYIPERLWCFITEEYRGDEEVELMCVRLDEKMLEAFHVLDTDKAIYNHPGEIVFVSYSYGGGPYFEATLEDIAQSLTINAAELMKFKDKQEG